MRNIFYQKIDKRFFPLKHIIILKNFIFIKTYDY